MSSNLIIQQHHLEKVVCSLFPGEYISNNVKKQIKVVNPATGRLLELDCWIKKYNLAFEFQDAYHYITTRLSHLSLGIISRKDNFKMEAMHKKVETLLLIPCWWDGTPESLISTIKFFRPDLLGHMQSNALPISMNPPPGFFERFVVGNVPQVGELMLASHPDSSKFIKSVSKSNAWWIGEKYDGVRMCWNPKDKKLYSRSGLRLRLLKSFVSLLIESFLDGEIWFGRGLFLESYKVAQSLLQEINWSFLRMISFDDPEPKHNSDKYERRYARILSRTPLEHPFMAIPSRFLCVSKRRVARALERIINEGGEGIILQKPKSPYEHGRSPSLAKLKASRSDHEAIVVRVKEESAEFQTAEGILFSVLQKDIQLPHALKKGDIVSFVYDTYSKRTAPVNPKIYRIRADIVWADVIREAVRDSIHSLNSPSSKAMGHMANPKGYWIADQNSNLRSMLIKFAQSKGLDPLVPDTWYSVNRKSVEEFADTRAALGVFRGGFVKTLITLFPNIGLEENKFNVKSNYWDNVPNRRSFFVEFARKSGFDPLHASNWYNIYRYKPGLLQAHGAQAVLAHYDDRLVSALVHLFPEVKFNNTQFKTSLQRYYESKENRKNFFVQFAKSKPFDPLDATNWYSVSLREIEGRQGSRYVLSYYRSLPDAIRRIFPNVLFDSKFVASSPEYRKESKTIELNKSPTLKDAEKSEQPVQKGRIFFDNFAKAQKFDPLVANNWYSISPLQIRKFQGYRQAVKRYNGSWRKALVDLYPGLMLKLDQFEQLPGGYWLDMANRRTFLEHIAKEKHLDPAEASTWSIITYKDVHTRKGGSSLLYYYNGNFTKAIHDIFPERLKGGIN